MDKIDQNRYFQCVPMGLLTLAACARNKEQAKAKWIEGIAVKVPVNRACCRDCTRVVKFEETLDPEPILGEAAVLLEKEQPKKRVPDTRSWLYEK